MYYSLVYLLASATLGQSQSVASQSSGSTSQSSTPQAGGSSNATSDLLVQLHNAIGALQAVENGFPSMSAALASSVSASVSSSLSSSLSASISSSLSSSFAAAYGTAANLKPTSSVVAATISQSTKSQSVGSGQSQTTANAVTTSTGKSQTVATTLKTTLTTTSPVAAAPSYAGYSAPFRIRLSGNTKSGYNGKYLSFVFFQSLVYIDTHDFLEPVNAAPTTLFQIRQSDGALVQLPNTGNYVDVATADYQDSGSGLISSSKTAYIPSTLKWTWDSKANTLSAFDTLSRPLYFWACDMAGVVPYVVEVAYTVSHYGCDSWNMTVVPA